MNNEKVKEIKECLQNCINDCGATSCPYDKYDRGLKCIEDLQKDALTLINELESENANLSAIVKAHKYCVTSKHCLEVKALKDRIAELETLCNKTYEDLTKEIDRLEKEIEENAFYSKGYAQGIKNTYEVVIPDKLKQFAERLKEKMGVREYMGIKYKQGVFSENDIDETLKEFLDG